MIRRDEKRIPIRNQSRRFRAARLPEEAESSSTLIWPGNGPGPSLIRRYASDSAPAGDYH
jgi:hypothetical protein